MQLMKEGFIYYVCSTLLLAVLLMCYIAGSSVSESMDALGWLFFLTSCVGHSAVVLMALWLLFFFPWALLRWRRVAVFLLVGSFALLGMLAFVNLQVFKIYRFHINGFIFNMLTGPAAGDIFDFDTKLYLSEGLLLVVILMVMIVLWRVCVWMAPRWRTHHHLYSAIGFIAILLVANGCYMYGSFVMKPTVVKSAKLIPYYFPLSASSLLQDLGFERQVVAVDDADGEGELVYPLEPLNVDLTTAKRPNIIFLMIDSWSRLALTEETMPHLWQLAHEEQWFQNHISCANGTMFGVFGVFTGLQPYYWTAFEASRTSPLLIDQLLAEGYDFRAYPSASLQSPPFDRVLFQKVPNLRVDTEGATSFDRDQRIKSDFIADLPLLKQSGKPFFAFVFFDLLHAYSLPKELLNRFQPSWEYGKFNELHNEMDPTPFWNLYRNSAYQTDLMVHEVVEALKEEGLFDDALLFITGDHAQEYNENHKNYWGHASNFSQYQIAVPLLVHEPGPSRAEIHQYRTTHYDFVPTLMHDYLGVKNPITDYSAGRLLSDETPRLWHFVGNELCYAFLVEGDTILTKEGSGYIDVTDAHLNPVDNYHIQPKAFNQAIQELNRFFK